MPVAQSFNKILLTTSNTTENNILLSEVSGQLNVDNNPVLLANSTVPNLSELTEAPADLDLLIIQDSSDTTGSLSGTSKKITVSNFLTNVGSGSSLSASGAGAFITKITCGSNNDVDDGITLSTQESGEVSVNNFAPLASATVDNSSVRVYVQWEGNSSEWTGTPYVNGSAIPANNTSAIGGQYARRFEGYIDLDLSAYVDSSTTVSCVYQNITHSTTVSVAGSGPEVSSFQVTSSPQHGQDHYKDGDDVTVEITFNTSDVSSISFEGETSYATSSITDSTNFTLSGSVATMTVPVDTTLDTETSVPFKITAKNALGTTGTAYTSTATINVISGPVIVSASVGTYPTTNSIQQTELKNGDTVPVTFTFDTNNVDTIVFSGTSSYASGNQTVSSVSVSNKSATVNMDISGTTVSNNSGGSDLPFNASARHVSTHGQTGPTFNSGTTKVTVNNQTPTISAATVTYPTNQSALKDSEQATVNMVVTNQGSSPTYTYSDPSTTTELTISSASTYSADKQVTRQGGGYNVSSANFQLLVNRNENGTNSTQTAIVNIADTAPTLTVSSNGGTRMRSGGNDGTSQQNYDIVISTGGQRLIQAPTLGAPEGTLGTFSHSANATTFTASMGVHDNDSKGTHTYSSINAVNLAGKTVTTIGSGSQYTFGGFVSRTKTLTAQTNEVEINVLHVTYTKVTLSWSGNSSVNSRQAIDTTTQTTNGWCLASTASTPVTVRILDFSKTSASSVDTTITIEETI